jgi:hypothetical protein
MRAAKQLTAARVRLERNDPIPNVLPLGTTLEESKPVASFEQGKKVVESLFLLGWPFEVFLAAVPIEPSQKNCKERVLFFRESALGFTRICEGRIGAIQDSFLTNGLSQMPQIN